MIVNKYANGGGGSGSGSTDLSGYWNSAETQFHIDSAVTPVSEHLFDVEQVTASALTELHDGLLEVSARTVDMSGYWDSAATKEYVDEAVSGISVDATVLKGTDTTDMKTDEYPGQAGDIRSWIFFDERAGVYWDVDMAQTTEPMDYTNTDERIRITGAGINSIITKKEGEYEEEAPENSFDGFEFWFNESNVYGEGPTYRCYWDSTNEEFKVEDAEGVVSGDFIIEPDPEDETVYLVLSPNRKVRYFRISYSSWDYCIADDCYWINSQDIDYGDTDASEAIYHIVKFNDASWFEYLGTYVSDGVSVRQEGEWVQIPTLYTVENELHNYVDNYAYSKNDTLNKYEISNLVSASAATPSWTKNEINKAVSGLATEQYVQNSVNGLATEQYVHDALSGVSAVTILRGTELPENPEVGDVVSKVSSGIVYYWEFGDGVTSKMPIDYNELAYKVNEQAQTFMPYEIAEFYTDPEADQINLVKVFINKQTSDQYCTLEVVLSGNMFYSGELTTGYLECEIPLYDGTKARIVYLGNDLPYGGNTMIQIGRWNGSSWEGSATDIPNFAAFNLTIPNKPEGIFVKTYSGWESIAKNTVSSTSVSTIWKGTQAEYDAETTSGQTADPTTLYIII